MHHPDRPELSPHLPVAKGICMVILHIEDALLSELPDLLAEYFCRGKNCAVSYNSVIVFRSISHLVHRGLTNYITTSSWDARCYYIPECISNGGKCNGSLYGNRGAPST